MRQPLDEGKAADSLLPIGPWLVTRMRSAIPMCLASIVWWTEA